MEYYVKPSSKGRCDDDADWQSDWRPHYADVCAGSDGGGGTSVLRVKAGSALPLLNAYASKQLADASIERVVFRGLGPSCTKAISCAEVLKRDHDHNAVPLHQINRVAYKRFEDVWEPETGYNLDRLKVNRDVPMIFIMLSKSAVDPATRGYQPANTWQATDAAVPPSRPRKKARKPVGSTKGEKNAWRRQRTQHHQQQQNDNAEQRTKRRSDAAAEAAGEDGGAVAQ